MCVNQKSDPLPILVLDSGMGGLSVCQSLLQTELALRLIYFADDALFPYGLLTEEALTKRLLEIVEQMLTLHQPELVVLACNTVSTLVLPQLRSRFDVPFVGVVPAIKPAAALSKTRSIGLLATPATVKRPYIDTLINDFAKDCRVVRVGNNDLVVQAERKMAGKEVCLSTLREALEPFQNLAFSGPAIDTVVLGCTHFPLLKEELQVIMSGVNWVDSGEAIARRVTSLLAEKRAAGKGRLDKRVATHQLYFSYALPDEAKLKPLLKKLGFEEITIALHRI